MKRRPADITDEVIRQQRPVTVTGRLAGVWTGLHRCVIQVEVSPDAEVEIGGAA